MVDHDHPSAGQASGEDDPARQGGVDDLSERAGQVDPAMTRAPRRARGLEAPHHLWGRLQRPHPDRNRGHGRADRAGRPRQGDERDQHDGDDDRSAATVAPDRAGE